MIATRQVMLESYLQDYTQLLALALCNGQCSAQETQFTERAMDLGWPHHKGAFTSLMSGPSEIDLEHIEHWAVDTEQGLLHGFLLGFWRFVIEHEFVIKDKVAKEFLDPNRAQLRQAPELVIDADVFTDSEVWLPSCIFSSFAKSHPSHEQSLDLSDYFDQLAKPVYTPEAIASTNSFARALKLESLRYEDIKKPGSKAGLPSFTAEYTHLMEHFYRYIRPALEKVFRYRYDSWCRHTMELPGQFDLSGVHIDYPQTHWDQANNPYFSIEIGSLPLQGCLLHTRERWSPYGLLSLTDLKRHGIKITSLPNRDHLGAKGQSPLNEWIFALDEGNEINPIVVQSAGLISIKLLNTIVRTTQLVIDNLKVLRS